MPVSITSAWRNRTELTEITALRESQKILLGSSLSDSQHSAIRLKLFEKVYCSMLDYQIQDMFRMLDSHLWPSLKRRVYHLQA
jgi:hypothetical protein